MRVKQTPLTILEMPGSDCCHIANAAGEEIAFTDSVKGANSVELAEFIVRACNCHNALLVVAKSYCELLEALGSQVSPGAKPLILALVAAAEGGGE